MITGQFVMTLVSSGAVTDIYFWYWKGANIFCNIFVSDGMLK